MSCRAALKLCGFRLRGTQASIRQDGAAAPGSRPGSGFSRQCLRDKRGWVARGKKRQRFFYSRTCRRTGGFRSTTEGLAAGGGCRAERPPHTADRVCEESRLSAAALFRTDRTVASHSAGVGRTRPLLTAATRVVDGFTVGPGARPRSRRGRLPAIRYPRGGNEEGRGRGKGWGRM